jgi:hypothetical protein
LQDDISNNLNLLLEKIDLKREEMITTAMKTSFTSEETIKCSQELDQLIIHYQTYKIIENRVGFYQSFLNTISSFVLQPILSINKIK